METSEILGLVFTHASNLVLTHFQLCSPMGCVLGGSNFCQDHTKIDQILDKEIRSWFLQIYSFPC